MKTLITIVALAAISFQTSAQCPTATCNASFTFPIDANNYNNNSAQNKCISGDGTFTNNLNEASNWHDWSFNGNIIINQTININQSKRLYLSGNIQLNAFSMAGGADSSIIYVAGNSTVIANNVQNPNNYFNYVYLGQNSTFTMGGVSYSAGDTYIGSGNSTNVVHFVSCNNTPLGLTGFKFENGILYWDYPKGTKIELQYSDNARDYITILSTDFSSYQYTPTESGYYRIKGISKVLRVNIYMQDGDKRIILYRVGDIYGTKKIK